MLRVSKPKYSIGPLQLLLPSRIKGRSWYRRRLHMSTKAELKIQLCTNSFEDLKQKYREMEQEVKLPNVIILLKSVYICH